jgi:thymidylate synthase
MNKKLTKEEFLQKLKTDKEFNDEFGNKGIDQIQNLINDLKTNPDSRRMMVNCWNVGELNTMVLPPCHYGFQVYTRELSEGERGLLLQPYGLDPLTKEGRDRLWKENNLPTRAISLMWNQRSVDTFLGLPFNIASYGLLLEIIAKEVNMVPDELIGNLGDTHIYLNHIEQAKEQIGREPFELPKLSMDYREGEYDKNLKDFVSDDFYLINYQSHPTIKAPLSN